MSRLDYLVTTTDDGCLLGKILQYKMKLSKRLISRLKKTPMGITVNGCHQTVRYVVHEGDVVSTAMNPTRKVDLPIEETELDVLYEDDYLLVAMKPRGVTMYPRYRGEKGSFSGAVLGYLSSKSEIPVYHPIYRLDRGVSGLVLLAKSSYVAARLNENMPNKVYQALIHGICLEQGAIHEPLSRVSAEAIDAPVIVVDPKGRPCTTFFQRIFSSAVEDQSAVMIRLKTGHRHQIRVHLAYIGHPVLGDVRYGSNKQELRDPRLHMAYLSFRHPITKEYLQFFCGMKDVEVKWQQYFNKEVAHVNYLAQNM